MRLGWIWSLLPRPSAQRPKTCRTTPRNHIQNITLFRRTTAPQQFQHLTRRKAALYLSREVIDGRGEREEQGEESRGRRKETAALICEVLHRVLYPNTHKKMDSKKKKRREENTSNRPVHVSIQDVYANTYSSAFPISNPHI